MTVARLHKLAIGSLDRHQPGSLLCRQPSGNSVWQSGLQNAMSMAFCEADCHDRNQNGIFGVSECQSVACPEPRRHSPDHGGILLSRMPLMGVWITDCHSCGYVISSMPQAVILMAVLGAECHNCGNVRSRIHALAFWRAECHLIGI